ncbi:hypothetical protein [Rickettsia endosymbiont of Cardiosporidium cionae]|uniref:hypothetical protein n=1 Tax=Rickettsia endosymbiont of Cardiosporidium cionae TaxID=2777155 RepID=UPI0018934DEE|nr:hypothetical protein [Rickettsia endosymbiont of Cardiosporidium cionae]KAF8818885.1 hypothetical protein IHI24_000119 [Rickettsia endosymbiont of Cardiosporidium cionae]
MDVNLHLKITQINVIHYMNQFNTYYLLFQDIVFSNFIFSFNEETILCTMQSFGIKNPFLVLFIASISYCLISVINFAIGWFLYYILLLYKKNMDHSKTDCFRSWIGLIIMIVLSNIGNIGKFVIFFSKFLYKNNQIILLISLNLLFNIYIYASIIFANANI